MVHCNNLARAAIALASTARAAPAPRDSYNFVLHPDHPLALAKRNASLMKRQNYVQDYTTGGDVQFSHAGDYFSLSFDTTEDFVVGIGWNPGSTAPITHQGSFSVAQGLGTLSVYGWSTNPLVEYYVIEDSSGFAQTGTEMGTLESDGSSYTIWKNTRTNEPSIEGTSTFNQYISIRSSPRASGTVTIENHFSAWASHGMDLGTLNFQVIAVESWNGAGSAQQTVAQS